jgi:hypothetical protein
MEIATVLLIAVVLLVLFGTAVLIHRDGYRRTPTLPLGGQQQERSWR